MKNYKRQSGDDILADDPRLQGRWEWCRVASGYNFAQLKDWTHFQTSECEVDKWTLEAVQWHGYYEARISYVGNHISSDKDREGSITTRIDAQVRAEKLLTEWITKEHARICAIFDNGNQGRSTK